MDYETGVMPLYAPKFLEIFTAFYGDKVEESVEATAQSMREYVQYQFAPLGRDTDGVSVFEPSGHARHWDWLDFEELAGAYADSVDARADGEAVVFTVSPQQFIDRFCGSYPREIDYVNDVIYTNGTAPSRDDMRLAFEGAVMDRVNPTGYDSAGEPVYSVMHTDFDFYDAVDRFFDSVRDQEGESNDY